MKEGFGFDVPGRVRFENFRENFLCRLHEAFGPAGLLGFEAIHVDGQVGGAFDVWEIEKFPAFELGAVGKVGVFGECVVLPSAGSVDSGATPDSCGAIEIKESAAAGTGAVFDDEVAVEQNGFDLGEERIVAIEIGPAGLDHADVLSSFAVEEIGNGAAEEIGFGDEVSVENGDKFAAG